MVAQSTIQASVSCIMRDMGVSSIGRTFGLDIMVRRVRETHADAARSDVWEAACAVADDGPEPEDDIAYEDCREPAWGGAGYSC